MGVGFAWTAATVLLIIWISMTISVQRNSLHPRGRGCGMGTINIKVITYAARVWPRFFHHLSCDFYALIGMSFDSHFLEVCNTFMCSVSTPFWSRPLSMCMDFCLLTGLPPPLPGSLHCFKIEIVIVENNKEISFSRCPSFHPLVLNFIH